MSAALYRLGQASFRRHWTVLVAWVTVALLAAGTGTLAFGGTTNSLEIPGSQSQEALHALDRTFPEVSGVSAQLVVRAPEGRVVTDEQSRADLSHAVERIRGLEDVSLVVSPYDEAAAGAVSVDQRTAIVHVQFGVALTEVDDGARKLLEEVATDLEADGYAAAAGGQAFTNTGPGVTRTEALGVAVAFLVLLVTFGAVAPATLPILTALVGAACSLSLTAAATGYVEISSTTPLLGLMIGLAVGIDYALFIVSRHRELLAQGVEAAEAAGRSLATAGSAVVFAGGTVIIALLALAVPGIPFLRTMGIFAALSVLIAVLVALTILPAMFGVLGARLRPRGHASRRPAGMSRSWVRAVTRWPVLSIAAVVIVLGAASLPAVHLELALPDNGTAEKDSSERRAFDLIDEEFGPGYNAPILIYADLLATTDPQRVIADLGRDVAQVEGVERVALATPNASGDTGIVQLFPTTSAASPEAAELVERLRGEVPDWNERYGITTGVTGLTAVQIDTSAQLQQALVPFALLVAGISLVLLMVVFRSLLVPIKATLGYLLSVGASFGAVVAVFQWGWLAEVVGVDRTGPVISFLPIILMGVLFGLAMDYEVFLVSRMKEAYSRTMDASVAVHDGFIGSARVVTAAAVIMICVFAAFIPEGDATVKPIAFGLAVGVLVDAFLVRMIFVPAALTVLGDRAWLLPRALQRRLPHVDIEGEAVVRRADLETWPRPGSRPAVAAAALAVQGATGADLFQAVNIDIDAGDWLLVRGEDGVGKTTLLLTLAGRMTQLTGTLKVQGHLLPEDAGAVRAQVALGEFSAVNALDEGLTVDQHIAERLSAGSFGLWVSQRRVAQVRDNLNDVIADVAAAQSLTPPAPLAGPTTVGELGGLSRLLLGVTLALATPATVIAIDDADVVWAPEDALLFFSVLARMTAQHPNGPVTVLMSAHPHTDLPDLPGTTIHTLDLRAHESKLSPRDHHEVTP